jgi:hypothetical protein
VAPSSGVNKSGLEDSFDGEIYVPSLRRTREQDPRGTADRSEQIGEQQRQEDQHRPKGVHLAIEEPGERSQKDRPDPGSRRNASSAGSSAHFLVGGHERIGVCTEECLEVAADAPLVGSVEQVAMARFVPATRSGPGIVED